MNSRLFYGKKVSYSTATNKKILWPPKLLKLEDKSLNETIFGLKATKKERKGIEFIGDRALDFAVTRAIHMRCKPAIQKGQIKEILVSNDLLFDISIAYKLHERLGRFEELKSAIYKDEKCLKIKTEPKCKAVADIFESYIGALVLTKSTDDVLKWLTEVYDPFILAIKDSSETPKNFNRVCLKTLKKLRAQRP